MTNNEILNELNLFELNPSDFEEHKVSAIESGGEYWDAEKMSDNGISGIKVYSGGKEVQEAIEVVTGLNGYVIFAPKPVKVKDNKIVTVIAKGDIVATTIEQRFQPLAYIKHLIKRALITVEIKLVGIMTRGCKNE